MAFVVSLQLLVLFLATISALPTSIPTSTPDFFCGRRPADIVFLVDTSSSIGRTNFGKYVLPFVSNVTDKFDIGPGPSQVRVGVVTFSDFHNLEFDLDDYMEKEKLKEKISSIEINGGNTNTGEALTYVTDNMFKAENGSRKNVSHIVIILTDGASQDYTATERAAETTHAKGLQVFAIGVGSKVNDDELNYLASDPDSDFKFLVTSFKALDKIQTKLSKKTCEVTTLSATSAPSTTPLSTSTSRSTPSLTTRTTSATTASTDAKSTQEVTSEPEVTTEYTGYLGDEDIRTRACGGKPADVYFILDSSGSINKTDFSNETLDFVRNVSSLFDIGPGQTQTRVGIVTFSDDVSHIFPLNAHASRDDLLNAVSPVNIPHKAQGTNTAEALRFVQEEGFSPDVARSDVAHVAIVITDGQSEDVQATLEAAKAARESGIYIFAIGVGKSADQHELKDISSDPNSNFVFKVKDYAALIGIRDLLAIRTCTVDQPDELQFKEQAACGLDNAELVFVYDSFSMGLNSTRRISTEVSQIAATVSRRVDNLSAGAISQSCPPGLDIPVRSGARFARQALLIQNSITSKIATLMKDARRKLFSRKQSGRKVMVLYVDDTSLEKKQDLVSQFKYANFSGIEVFVVAVGKVSPGQVSDFTSKPLDNYVINVDSPRDLPKFRNEIIGNLCNDHLAVKTTSQPKTTTPFIPRPDIQ